MTPTLSRVRTRAACRYRVKRPARLAMARNLQLAWPFMVSTATRVMPTITAFSRMRREKSGRISEPLRIPILRSKREITSTSLGFRLQSLLPYRQRLVLVVCIRHHCNSSSECGSKRNCQRRVSTSRAKATDLRPRLDLTVSHSYILNMSSSHRCVELRQ